MAAISTNFLTGFQKGILEEAMLLRTGGTLNVPMGTGKTPICLAHALITRADDPGNSPALIVVPKTLLPEWTTSIDRFFPGTPYCVLHSEYRGCKAEALHHFDISSYHIVITTPEAIAGHYKALSMSQKLLNYRREIGKPEILHYRQSHQPLGGANGGSIYTTQWSYFALDEGSKYLNHGTDRTRSLIAISAKTRWLLSGTILSQPSAENVFGYFLLIGNKDIPRNRPEFLFRYNLGTLPRMADTFVTRKVNEDYIPEKLGQKVHHTVVSNTFTKEEADLFLRLKNVIKVVNDQVKEYKAERERSGDRAAYRDEIKLLTGMLLGFIVYLRQALVCPLIPITNMYIGMADLKHRDEVTASFTEQLVKLNPAWLDDEKSVYSSRLRKVVELIRSHPDERVVVFSAYRTTLDILQHYLPEGRAVHTISGSYSSKKREQEVTTWGEEEGSILTLTYEVGACGLNLQKGKVAIIMDYGWDMDLTKQAIARIVRRGQESKDIYVYYLTSNTGVERGIYTLHLGKKDLSARLEEGLPPISVPKLKLRQMVKLIEMEEVCTMLGSMYKKEVK